LVGVDGVGWAGVLNCCCCSHAAQQDKPGISSMLASLCLLLPLCCHRRLASPASWRPPSVLLSTTGAGTAAWSPCRCAAAVGLC
jgi:hypothetical protein